MTAKTDKQTELEQRIAHLEAEKRAMVSRIEETEDLLEHLRNRTTVLNTEIRTRDDLIEDLQSKVPGAVPAAG